MKVSVAIPAYNCEDFIERCIDSVLNQSMSTSEYEIIIVDDLSKDSTRTILGEYEKKNENIKVIFREENSGGASEPRNNAIDVAIGEYIYFLDADDYLGEKALEKMYAYGLENNTDIVVGKYKGVNGRGVPKAAFEKGNIKQADILDNNLFYTVSVQKMFRLSLIKELDLKFMKNAKTAEDQLFTVVMYCNCKGISILSDYDCYYLTKHDGEHLSKSSVEPRSYFKIMAKIIDAIYEGKLGNADYKNKLVGKYLTRIFRHAQNKNFYKNNNMSESLKK